MLVVSAFLVPSVISRVSVWVSVVVVCSQLKLVRIPTEIKGRTVHAPALALRDVRKTRRALAAAAAADGGGAAGDADPAMQE